MVTRPPMKPCPVCGSLQTQTTYQRHVEGHALNWRYADKRNLMPHQRRPGRRKNGQWPKA